MKVCFVVSDLGRSGGVATLLGHARRLAESHGAEVQLVFAGAVPDGAGELPVGVATIDQAEPERFDVAIGTWWETAPALWRVQARRRLVFVQSAEEAFYGEGEPLERLGAAMALQAADGYIVISSWLADVVARLRPDAPIRLVPNGIDKLTFDGARRPTGDRLRVLVDGQPSVWLKGVDDALAALARVEAPIEVTLACPRPEDAAGISVDRLVGGLEPHEMAEVLASTDVLVKLSRLEGLGLGPLEGFHHGVPCVVTPFGGERDYLRHGENGLRVGYDDTAAVTAWVDRLATDSELRDSLSTGARAFAADWPDPAASTRMFAAALEAALEAPAAPPPMPAMLAQWRAVAEQDRVRQRTQAVRIEDLAGALHWNEVALEQARADVDHWSGEASRWAAEVDRLNDLVGELEYSRKDVARMLQERVEELESIKQTRSYRAAAAARGAVERVRR